MITRRICYAFSSSVHVFDLLGPDNGADSRRSYHRLSRTGDNESSLLLTLISAFYRVFRHQVSHEVAQESRSPPVFGSRLVERLIKNPMRKFLSWGRG